MEHYIYSTIRGKAVLNKGNDKPLMMLGQFKTEAEALAQCKAHYGKACNFLALMNKGIPEAFYI